MENTVDKQTDRVSEYDFFTACRHMKKKTKKTSLILNNEHRHKQTHAHTPCASPCAHTRTHIHTGREIHVRHINTCRNALIQTHDIHSVSIPSLSVHDDYHCCVYHLVRGQSESV